MEPFQDELRRRREQPRALDGPDEARDGLLQPGNLTESLLVLVRTHAIRDLDAPAGLEVRDDALAALEREVLVPDLQDSAVDEALDQVALALLLATVLELDLADRRCRDGGEVRQARDDLGLAGLERTLLRVRDERLVVVDGDAYAHARRLVDLVRGARLHGELREDLLQELRDARRQLGAVDARRLLLDDRDLFVERARIVRADLDVEPVLQRRDDAAAARVVLGVRRREDHDVERQPDLVAFDLDGSRRHQVQEADRHIPGQLAQR